MRDTTRPNSSCTRDYTCTCQDCQRTRQQLADRGTRATTPQPWHTR